MDNNNNNDNELEYLKKGLSLEQNLILERIPKVFTEENTAKAIANIRSFMKDHSFTNKQLADRCGFSQTTVSQLINGKYPGDTPKALTTIIKFMNAHCRNKLHHNEMPEYVETSVAREIGALITNTTSFSQSEGKIGLVIGDGGHGKTHCLQAWCKVNPHNYYIRLHSCMTNKDIMVAIAKTVGSDYSGSIAYIIDKLAAELADRFAVIIIDEASNLKVKTLDLLRQAICLECGCPMILSGNAALIKTIHKDSARSGYESIDQFNSRVMRTLNLDLAASTSTDPNTGLYTEKDIIDLYQYQGIGLAKDAVDTLRKICQTPHSGRLRVCADIIKALHTSPDIYKAQLITGQNIITAIRMLQLPFADRLPVTVVKPKHQTSSQQAKATA